ncbi:hypothetical protein HPB49_005128 [Dermacentor silvarum]|uniref:Uncharacterized protein n=1 Tax=Dermacentor silvarum TaxID=543639 RepID=A0ACB8CDD2_DERSI|nr:hypothetical protein HPB49_005128 [Dermacentor silvarum]
MLVAVRMYGNNVLPILSEFRPILDVGLFEGSCHGVCANGFVDEAMVATEGFLSIDPVGELNVACKGQNRTVVPGHGVANPSWVDRVSVKSEASVDVSSANLQPRFSSRRYSHTRLGALKSPTSGGSPGPKLSAHD